jgi:hypothetical protein
MKVRHSIIIGICLVSGFQSPAQELQPGENQLVPITTPYSLSKKSAKTLYRLQVLIEKDSTSVLGYGLPKLPSPWKSFRFSSSKTKQKRKAIQAEASASLDSVYSFLSDTSQGLSFKIPSPHNFIIFKTRFLAGHKATQYFSSQWITLSKQPSFVSSDHSFRTRGFFRTHHLYNVEFLPGAVAWALPILDPWNCEPAAIRFFKLKKADGYGIDKIKYVPYEGITRINIRSAFEVYFPHNEITPDAVGFNKVAGYLEQNNYVILNATLEGGCSLEGAPERNHYLQKQRASVLKKALHKYCDELLKKDTVMLTDVVSQFRELIQKTPQKYLDTLTDDLLIKKINSDEELRKLLEPVFILQRKASLKLVVAKRLSIFEQLERVRNMLNKASAELIGNSANKSVAEQKVMGLIEKLFIDFENGIVSESDLNEIIEEANFSNYVKVLVGYHFLKKFEESSLDPANGKIWENYWKKNLVEDRIITAQQNLIELFDADKTQRVKYMRMLNDFQAYIFRFTEIGLIDINSLCNIPYPERPEFMGLILNQYAYLYLIASTEGNNAYCMPGSVPVTIKRDSLINTDAFIQNIQKSNPHLIGFDLIGKRLVSKKNFDPRPKGPYYYLLKQHYVKNNKSILENVAYTDNSENVTLSVFNLWHLISVNVTEWNPFENHFYDKDIQLEEMDKLISAMKKLDAQLCKPQTNEMYMSYHLKMLYYLEHYAEPGNPAHAKYGDAALKFITGYYKARAKSMNSTLALHVVKQLNLFNWLPGNEEGAFYGNDLFNAIAGTRLLSDEEFKLYAHYQKIYNPQLKKIPPLYDREKILKAWNEPY